MVFLIHWKPIMGQALFKVLEKYSVQYKGQLLLKSRSIWA